MHTLISDGADKVWLAAGWLLAPAAEVAGPAVPQAAADDVSPHQAQLKVLCKCDDKRSSCVGCNSSSLLSNMCHNVFSICIYLSRKCFDIYGKPSLAHWNCSEAMLRCESHVSLNV